MSNMQSTSHSQTHSHKLGQVQTNSPKTNNLKNLFKNSKPEEILSFLKEINLFIKI